MVVYLVWEWRPTLDCACAPLLWVFTRLGRGTAPAAWESKIWWAEDLFKVVWIIFLLEIIPKLAVLKLRIKITGLNSKLIGLSLRHWRIRSRINSIHDPGCIDVVVVLFVYITCDVVPHGVSHHHHAVVGGGPSQYIHSWYIVQAQAGHRLVQVMPRCRTRLPSPIIMFAGCVLGHHACIQIVIILIISRYVGCLADRRGAGVLDPTHSAVIRSLVVSLVVRILNGVLFFFFGSLLLPSAGCETLL